MEHKEIISLAKDYLNKPYSEDYISDISKTPKKFFASIVNLNEHQIRKVLTKKPEYSNVISDGWHSLNYACLTNNPEIVSLFIEKSIANGLTHLPKTTKSKKGIPNNLTLLHFCSAFDLDKSYAKILTCLTNLEEQEFNITLRYGLFFNNSKVPLFVKPIIGEDIYQKEMLDFYVSHWKNENGSIKPRSHDIFIKNFKGNIDKFKDFEIDVCFKLDGRKNYFTSTLEMFINYQYEIEEMGFDKFKKTINYFLSNGYSLNEKDGEDKTPRSYLERFIKNVNDFSFENALTKFIPEIEKKSLSNELKNENTLKTKKIKI